jgi:methionine sulfoxide reductase heme-binding subunit
VRAPLRHLVVLACASVLVWAFYAMRLDGLHHVHRWNRAFADASVTLLSALFVLGPVARIWPKAARSLPWRRELGVWAFALALVHVGYYADQAFGWSLQRFVQDSQHHGTDGSPVGPLEWRRDAFAAANWVGIIALAYGILPLLTSNDLSQRLLGSSWKRLQDQGHIFLVLSFVHFLLFWLLVYVEPQVQPAPVVFGVLAAVVLLAQAAGMARYLAKRA